MDGPRAPIADEGWQTHIARLRAIAGDAGHDLPREGS